MYFDKHRIYYNAVFGALGGLISWAVIGFALRFSTTSLFLLFLKDALLGSVVGVCIGAAIGAVDGLTISRSARKAIRGAFLGGAIGLGAGLLGLVLGEIIFKVAGGGVWPRAVGWALFGLLVGTSEGIANRAPPKSSYGAIGGLLGGLIGGSTYERLSLILRALTHNRDLSLTVGGAVGLIILGACIGSLIGLVEMVLRRAWLKVIYGRLEGRTLTLAKQRNILGKADSCDVVIPGDSQVADCHAEIRCERGDFVLEAKASGVFIETAQGKQAVTVSPLQHGDKIQVGKTIMVFQTGRRWDMKAFAKRTALLLGLVAFAVLWVFLMSLGFSGKGSTVGADGSEASLNWIDADTGFPEIDLHLLVLDGAGEPLKGLQQKDFEATEDGIPLKITRFVPAGEQQVTAMLVIDRSGSMEGDKIAGARQAANTFVDLMRVDKDVVGLIAFSNGADKLQALTDDKGALTGHINSVRTSGGTAFFDAVYQAVSDLVPASGRRVVLALTDGKDNQSRRSLKETAAFAKDNGISIYTVGLGRGRDLNRRGLQKMADETGGEYHETPSPDELASLYQRIGEQVQNEYVLGYTSPTPRLDGTRRDVEVTVKHPGATLSTAGDYSVGGILAPSINPTLFAVLLALLLLLLLAPGLAPRVKRFRRAPKEAAETQPEPEPVLPVIEEPAPPLMAKPPLPTPKVAVARAWLVNRAELVKDVMTVGSAHSNDIVVADPAVAAQHAQVRREGDRFVVYDLSGGNTLVSYGGDPAQFRVATRNAVKGGSLLRFGNATYTFSQPSHGYPTLEQRHGLEKNSVTVGAAPDNDVVLAGPGVDPHHAELQWQVDRWVVSNLGSTGGTFVSFSGDPGQERQATRNALKHGSRVRFGGQVFTLELQDS